MWLMVQSLQEWLILQEALHGQLPKSDNGDAKLEFGVKFYLSDPGKMVHVQTKYLFFHQLMEDMRSQRLTCGSQTTVELCAFAVQALLGDFDPAEHTTGCASLCHAFPLPEPTWVHGGPHRWFCVCVLIGFRAHFRYMSRVLRDLGHSELPEAQIHPLHKLLLGRSPLDAEYEFLKLASEQTRSVWRDPMFSPSLEFAPRANHDKLTRVAPTLGTATNFSRP